MLKSSSQTFSFCAPCSAYDADIDQEDPRIESNSFFFFPDENYRLIILEFIDF